MSSGAQMLASDHTANDANASPSSRPSTSGGALSDAGGGGAGGYVSGPGGTLVMPQGTSNDNEHPHAGGGYRGSSPSNGHSNSTNKYNNVDRPSTAGELSYQDSLLKNVYTRKTSLSPQKSGGGKHLDQDDDF